MYNETNNEKVLHDSLKAEGKELPLVSVIMPVFNTQDYVAIAIESVLNQTYTNFELICVDDGSTDESANIIRSYMYRDSRISLTQIENHGQGYVRNMAVKTARGKYIQFLDADDYLSPYTLDLAVARAEKDESDIVIYDWTYYDPIGKGSRYVNFDAFFSKPLLVGEECLEILKISPIFTVNKLYRKSFLIDNGVVYGENYIYEDNPFWVKAGLYAKRVSTIHAPLYRVTVNPTSTTKVNLNTDKHCKGFVMAVEEIVRDFKKTPATDEARYSVFVYLLQKFAYYYTARTPKNLRRAFIRDFVDAIAELDVSDFKRDEYVTAYLRRNVFRRKRYGTFSHLINSYYVWKPRVKILLDKICGKATRIAKKLIKPFLKKNRPLPETDEYLAQAKRSLYGDVILFMGFDYRYTGNSRYLFEEMIKMPTRKKLFFVTDDVRVPFEYRLEPHSERANRFIARAKTVIFESWIPLGIVKRGAANWVQLWHGTPLKKMLYDSHEKSIIERNSEQKLSKFKDILRWDYLIVDNPEIRTYFETSFHVPESKLLNSGYPRVKYLLENKDNEDYKEKLREHYGIPAGKKVVLYLPTWRDYNYKTEDGEFDISYLLKPDVLSEKLGDDYFVVYKDHAFLSNSELVNYPNHDTAETQELLLLADYLVTDYSSVMFDAFAIDVPVVLYCNDFARNEEERGVYETMWNDIAPLCASDIDGVAESIKNYSHSDLCRAIKEKYAYKSELNLSEFIFGL